MILKELAKSDVKWREMAYNICRDKTLADELVQEMYLKVHANKDKDVWFRNDKLNMPYVYSILHNLFYDLQRSKSKVL